MITRGIPSTVDVLGIGSGNASGSASKTRVSPCAREPIAFRTVPRLTCPDGAEARFRRIVETGAASVLHSGRAAEWVVCAFIVSPSSS